jgi:hypothetical protein
MFYRARHEGVIISICCQLIRLQQLFKRASPWRPRLCDVPHFLCPKPGGGESLNMIYWCRVIRLNFSYVSDFRSECNLMLIITSFLFHDNIVAGSSSLLRLLILPSSTLCLQRLVLWWELSYLADLRSRPDFCESVYTFPVRSAKVNALCSGVCL